MGTIKDVAKTSVGIFAASVAVDAFRVADESDSPGECLAAKAIGSVAAATAFHVLKGDVKGVVADVVEIARKEQKRLT